MNKHTLTITLTETYTPSGDEAEYQQNIRRVIEDIVGCAVYTIRRALGRDVDLAFTKTHSGEVVGEKETG